MHPNHRGWRVVIVGAVFAGLATICVIARLYARFYICRRGGVDDYLIAVAWLFGIFTLITCLLEVAYGLGHEMASIPPNEVIKLLKVNYAFTILYITGTTLTRTSILFQLLRILTSRFSRITAWVLMAISATYGVAFMFALSFSCHPVSFAWDPSSSSKNGHCVSQPVIWVVYASINAVEDLAILVLPVHALWRLSLPWKKKVLVIFVMALGGSVCIITIVCFNHLAQNVQAMSRGDWDFSYNFVEPTIRAQLELYLGITCGCLPCLKPYFSCLFSSSRKAATTDDNILEQQGQGRNNPPHHDHHDRHGPHPPTIGTAQQPRRREGRRYNSDSGLRVLYLAEIDVEVMTPEDAVGEEEGSGASGDVLFDCGFDCGESAEGGFEIYRGHGEEEEERQGNGV